MVREMAILIKNLSSFENLSRVIGHQLLDIFRAATAFSVTRLVVTISVALSVALSVAVG